MMTGSAAFPGVKDSSDQLDKIWKVLGTPFGRDRDYFQLLPQYKTDCIIPQPPQSLTRVFPPLKDIPTGEDFALKFLQLNPRKRISAETALKDPFFSVIPQQVHDLSSREYLKPESVSHLLCSCIMRMLFLPASYFSQM